MLITTKELIRNTGASYRQIDYWCSLDILSPVGKRNPGSGHQREFDTEIIDRVILLVKASIVFDHGLRGNALKNIYDAYNEGYVDLGYGFILRWENEE